MIQVRGLIGDLTLGRVWQKAAARVVVLPLVVAAAFACALAGAPAALGDSSGEKVVFMSGDSNDVFSASYDGSSLRQITNCATDGCELYWPVLSPGGQTVAVESGNGTISLYSIDGSQHRIVVSGDRASFPSWSPDGNSILYTHYTQNPDGTAHSEIYSASTLNLNPLDASDTTPVITGPNNYEEASYSADGQSIVYDATSTPGGYYGLWIAKAGGTGQTQLDLSSLGAGDAFDAHFSPDGNRIAFVFRPAVPAGSNEADPQLYLINRDGSGLRELIPGTAGYYMPTWTPDGSEIFVNYNPPGSDHDGFINPDAATPTFTPIQTGTSYEDIGSTRTPSTAIATPQGTTDRDLADRFEPVLRFDSSEKWRPLNLDGFFGENDNQLCDTVPANLPNQSDVAGDCESTPLTSVDQLFGDNNKTAYLKVYPGDYSGRGDEAGYHSPYPQCNVNGLRDCDSGPNSSIYWGVPSSGGGGYRFIDYWFFYRANYFYGTIDWHEGDWEGVTVAPSQSLTDFDYVAFSQHGTYYSYLRNVLRCENTPASSIPAAGSCGTAGSPGSGQRVDVMVANGDHANYSTPCSETINLIPPFIHRCQQNGAANVERGYDGKQRWGNAYNAYALKAMPAGADSWPVWFGHWGSPKQAIFAGGGPASPGQQQFNFACAHINNGSGCTVPPSRGPTTGDPFPDGQGGGVVAASVKRRRTRSPGWTAEACASWIGPGISAVACDPARLRAAIRGGRVGRHGPMSVSVAGGAGISATGMGIAQYTGPVTNGMLLRLRGSLRPGTLVLLRLPAREGKSVIAVFRITQNRRLAAVAASTGRLTLRVHANTAGATPSVTLGSLRPVASAVVSS